MNKYGIGLGLLIILVSGTCFSCGCITQPVPEIVEVVEVAEVVEVVEVVEVDNGFELAVERLNRRMEFYSIDIPYEINGYDCDKMALITADIIRKTCGGDWNVLIGFGWREDILGGWGHAWVYVDYKGDEIKEWYIIECTDDPLNTLGVLYLDNNHFWYSETFTIFADGTNEIYYDFCYGENYAMSIEGFKLMCEQMEID
jgi:hypothetical protein